MRPPSRRLPGIGSHHSSRRQSDEWLTPPAILEALGPFDLDPCAGLQQPWRTAGAQLTVEDDGLHSPWAGRVWCNPPYSEAEAWIARMAEHGHGTALVFARTDTRWWQAHIWPAAAGILFLAGRVTFHHADGERSKAGHNSGGPSALVAYGGDDEKRLRASGLRGHLVTEQGIEPVTPVLIQEF